jgi:3,4-dihydroxy 2-butanone 4-phosphate synthase / GTP cyclohydrolase II
MQLIAAEGRGVVVLLRDTTMKLVMADEASPQTLRQYGLGAQILSSLGLSRTDAADQFAAPKVVGLDAYGLTIVGTRPIHGVTMAAVETHYTCRCPPSTSR